MIHPVWENSDPVIRKTSSIRKTFPSGSSLPLGFGEKEVRPAGSDRLMPSSSEPQELTLRFLRLQRDTSLQDFYW